MPRLRPDQAKIAKAAAKHKLVVVNMGRRWGKTVLGGVLCVASAARGGQVAWVVPSYKNGRPLWRWLEQILRPLVASGQVKLNKAERTVEFANGGFLAVFSASDQADAIRGNSFHLVVLDEASRISEEAWTDSIQPTLADYGGHAILISTPKGKNWFWREWMRGRDESQDEVRSFKAPTSDNPNPRIKEAARLAEQRVSKRTYEQEWLAEFIDDAGGVFKNVRACIRGELLKAPIHPQRRYVIGLDLAKHEDYTVLAVMDEIARQVVAFYRFNLDSWDLQKKRIYLIAKHWNNALIWMDSTGVGDAIFDDLQAAGLRVEGYKFTAPSKENLIDNAVLLVEQNQVGFPGIPVMVHELEAFQYERTDTGHIRMNAPAGDHDDCVIAFSLCCWSLVHMTQTPFHQWYEELQMGKQQTTSVFGGTDLMERTL